MTECPFCGFQNPEGIHICLDCASSLKQICFNCGAEVPINSPTCEECGVSLETDEEQPRETPTSPKMDLQERMLRDLRSTMPSALIEKFTKASKDLSGQKREVTVLFVEIAEFSKASKKLDSESIYLAVDEIVHQLSEVIFKYEGTIDKYSNNGIMALFGIPINHENDPERAVRAALEMQQRMSQMRDQLAARYLFNFHINIGINTGSVIAGQLGDQNHMEYTVIGNTVQLASHLVKSAKSEKVLVSFSTYQRSHPIIDYQGLPALTIEEISDPVKVFQPLGIRIKPGQVRGLPGLQVPMIGRTEQFEQVVELYRDMVNNNVSHILLCGGEAGIGKSRLVAEFQNELSGQAVIAAQGTCASYMRITPYRVVADVLRNLLSISEFDPPTEQIKVLSQRLDQHGLDRSEILPYLLHVLGILHSDPMLEVRIKLLEPSMLLRQTHFALRTFFTAEARLSPLVLVFDDLHWVDQASGQFLEYFCQSLENYPILLILVARDFSQFGITQSIHAAAGKHTRKPLELMIQPLSESDAKLLVGQLIHEATESAKELKDLITTRAGGNPYYTEELVRILLDHGGLIAQNGQWHVSENATALILEVPGTLVDIILARFDNLVDPLKQVLLKAVVLGDTFSARLLQAFVKKEKEELTNCLNELEQRDFLIHTRVGNDEGYIFKHPLLQETIYQTLLSRDRTKLHSLVAQLIVSGDYWLPGERNQILAYHLSESNEPAKAIPYLLISAQKAYQHFANDTVIQLYRQALSLMDSAEEVQTGQKELALVGLAQALKFTGELEESAKILADIVKNVPETGTEAQDKDNPLFQTQIEALRELADIRAREGNLDLAVTLLKTGMDMLGEKGRENYPNIWRRLIDRLAWVYFRQRNLEEAHNLADLALINAPASEAEDPITLASLYNTIGGIYWTQSRFADAIESVEQSLEIYKNLHYHWGMANSLTNLGILHFSTEKWSQAVDYLEQADRLRSEYGDDPERPVNLKNLGEVLIYMGDLENAREKLQSSKEISQRLGLQIAQTYAEFGLCRLSIVEHDLPEARKYLENVSELIESFDEINDRVANYYQLKAQIELQENDLKLAEKSIETALSIAQKGGMTEKQVDILRIMGEIYTKMGKYEKAEERLSNSITLAQEVSDRFSEAKARYSLGILFWKWSERDSSKRLHYLEQAERCFDAAIRIFDILGANPDLKNASNARAELQTQTLKEKASGDLAVADQQAISWQSQLDIPDGEWHQATICSVVLLPQRGTEEEYVFETIAFLIPSLIEIIEDNGGQVLRHQDSLTAVFGAPVTREDDPQLAVETAMQIINFYNGLNAQTEMPISMHLGVAMGKIVAGKVDLEQADEFMIAGEPVQLARQTAEACPSGRVWATQSVRNSTTYRFDFSPVPPNLTEKFEGITIFQLEGLREQILPVRGLIGLKSPFIGRKKEITIMQEITDVFSAGTGGIIWIEGDAGIGKSRLMREFADQVNHEGVQVLSGVCTARHSEYAFSLFSDLLMQAFDIQHNYTPKQITEHIDQKLEIWSPDLIEMRPFLQFLLGVHPNGTHGERITSMEPEQLRRQTFVAIHRLIGALASIQPLVLILDDLQWIDSISADLLLYLSHLVASQRVLFVCAQRQKEVSPYAHILERVRSIHPDQYVYLSIEPLTIEECRQLLSEFLSSADLPDTILSLIVQQSGGNPYFIEEFVRLLVEKEYLQVERGKLIANHTLQTDSLTIPASLESLIRARVDSLETPARQLLQVASVIGHRFNRTLLSQIAEQEDADQLTTLLHSRGMLNPLPEEDQWEFSHPLIEVVVYNTVLRAQRRILHSRTAKALENQWQGTEGEHAEDLAYHFGKAENYEKALHYQILAGERAAARHANEVAVSFFEQASELLGSVKDVSDEARWRIIRGMGEVYQFIGNYDASLAVLRTGFDLIDSPMLSPSQRAGLYRRLGDTAHKKGDQEQAIEYLQQALEIIGDPEDSQAEVEAALIYARLGWCQFMQSDLENAKDTIMKAMEFAGKANSITTLAMAENYLGGILYRQGDLEQAMNHTRTAMSYWQEMGYSWGVAAALSNLGILESISGNWQAAFNSIKRSLTLRQKMGDVDGVAITNHNLGHLARDQGDMKQAELHYRDSLAISIPFQMNHHAANSYIGLALSLLYQDKIDEADKELQKGLKIAEELNAKDVIIEAYCAYAEVLLARGKYIEAEKRARNAAGIAVQIGVSPLIASAWRLTAVSLLEQGKTNQASETLDWAWKDAADVQDNLEMGRLHTTSMQIAKATGDDKKVKEHYEAAKQIFTRLGASRDLKLLGSIK